MVLTLGEMIAMPISSNYVASLAPDDMRGRYMGVLGFSWNTAVGVGPMGRALHLRAQPGAAVDPLRHHRSGGSFAHSCEDQGCQDSGKSHSAPF